MSLLVDERNKWNQLADFGSWSAMICAKHMKTGGVMAHILQI
jgi:hypothetical protein